jgi:uncharacterized protein CbrC (UPF0167 family)
MSTLPAFGYHPDPIATESVLASDSVCVCCGQARGFVYVEPVYATQKCQDSLCPWCIAEGSANNKFDASFTDESGIGGYPATLASDGHRVLPASVPLSASVWGS